MAQELTKISKYLSFILRHQPVAIGLSLDSNGWASINELIKKTTDFELTHDLLNLVVETNDKQRFVIDLQQNKIRANQGHSIDVDLSLEPLVPPAVLLHGTAERFYQSIKQQGLTKQKRHHVHLSESATIATSVGSRYGKPILLEIDAKRMYEQGYKFYRSANNVWLVETVPSQFIKEKHVQRQDKSTQ